MCRRRSTLEILAAVDASRAMATELRVRVVKVVDLMTCAMRSFVTVVVSKRMATTCQRVAIGAGAHRSIGKSMQPRAHLKIAPTPPDCTEESSYPRIRFRRRADAAGKEDIVAFRYQAHCAWTEATMDDRTLFICAATLCVVGFPLTQVLGTNAVGRSQPQLASINVVIDKIRIGELGGRAADAFAPRTLHTAR